MCCLAEPSTAIWEVGAEHTSGFVAVLASFPFVPMGPAFKAESWPTGWTSKTGPQPVISFIFFQQINAGYKKKRLIWGLNSSSLNVCIHILHWKPPAFAVFFCCTRISWWFSIQTIQQVLKLNMVTTCHRAPEERKPFEQPNRLFKTWIASKEVLSRHCALNTAGSCSFCASVWPAADVWDQHFQQ